MAMLTEAMLRKHTEVTVRLPALSEKEGVDVEIRCRWIGREEYLALLPMSPPGSTEWAPEEFAQKSLEWFYALPSNARESRESQARDVLYSVVSLTTLEPKLTLDDVRQLGSDAETAAIMILRASRLLTTPAEAPAPEPAPA